MKLIGILIVVVGFFLKLDTIAVVLIAGITTGLLGGLNIIEILDKIGTTFVNSRNMSIFLLTLPVIGILERNGLRERAAHLINNLKSATVGKVLSTYTTIRMIAAALSLRLGGHVQFIRPLINPMAFGAAQNTYENVDEDTEEIIKGYAAASENYGNFFGQNVFITAGGVLLVINTLKEQGITVTDAEVSKNAIPVAIIALILAIIQNYLLDKKISRKLKVRKELSK
ncbi:DUF969 domain-containing protein [Clostridiaceae bacterium M8S5]|nr:DUF969 domain-containing protein [Clostridiaceae bacterium M8S5]